MAIIEAVLFNNELELLDARFREGDGVVDTWVIIESPETFTGEPKPLHFDEAQRTGRYNDFFHRIVHLVANPKPDSVDPWQREADQRDGLLRVLPWLQNDDLIVLSDGDELTRRDVWEGLLWETIDGDSVSLHKPTWYYTLTWALQDTEHGSNASYRSKAARVWALKEFGKPSEWADYRYFAPVEDTGWHLSCLGGPARLLNKLKSSSHQEITPEGGWTYEGCKKLIQEGIDCASTRGATLVRTEPSGPDWLIAEGVKKYPWLLTGDDPCTQLS
jgi:hypothetical protein